MTVIDGIEELVVAPGVFDDRRASILSDVFARGVRNVIGRASFAVGVAALGGIIAVAAPQAGRGEATFTERTVVTPADRQWLSSMDGLSALIADLRAGRRPAFGDELATVATEALGSVTLRKHEDVDAWAKALASEVAHLDD